MPNYEPGESVIRGDVTRAQLAEAAYRDEVKSERSDARILAQLDYMTEQLAITHKLFSMLTNSLEPILIPEIDGPDVAIDVHPTIASEMSHRIDDLNGQLSRLQHRIEQVNMRVQL